MVLFVKRRFVPRAGAALVFLLLVGTAGAAAQAAPDWKSYSYAADGFSVLFPSAPEVSKKNVDTAAGPFELRSYIVSVGDSAIFVGVCDYGNSVANQTADASLEGAKNGALENSKSHLVGTAQKITLGTYPGLDFQSETDSQHFHARIYWVGTTLYQVLVVTPMNAPYLDTDRFLDSFQLIARERN